MFRFPGHGGAHPTPPEQWYKFGLETSLRIMEDRGEKAPHARAKQRAHGDRSMECACAS